MIAVFREENALESVQRTPADADSLSHLQEGMRAPGSSFCQNRPDAFDLFVGDRQTRALNSDEAKHTVHATNPRPVLRVQRAAHENVTAK